MVQCQACHAETVFEHDPASGTAYCTICGSVAEENGIVAEVTFGENSTGAAVVNGAYVGADQTRVKASGGRRPAGAGGVESREQTIANGRRKIQAMINALRLPDRFTDPAQRFYTLALTNNFVRGRRTNYVVSACLYIVCRMEKTSHMLIDFSDLLQVNVFILGSTYLKLVRDLNLTIPAIDPSLYISRFASLLEFGDETQQVANDAVRLVQRFSRDWMHTGRRPAGICGAALVLAARMNNFRRSIEEVVQVVKIADGTLKKRLEEFSQTPSSALTITDFRTVDLNETVDPPAFIDNKKKETHQRTAKRGKKVRFSKTGVVSDDDEEEEGDEEEQAEQDEAEEEANGAPASSASKGAASIKSPKGGMQAINAQMDAMAAAGGTGLAAEEEDDDDDGRDDLNVPLFDERDEEGNIRSALASITAAEQEEQDTLRHARSRSRSATPAGEAAAELGWRQGSRPPAPDMRTAEEIARDEAESAEIAQSISTELSTKHYSAISGELTEKERNRWVNAQNPAALRFTNPPEVTSMDASQSAANLEGQGGEEDVTVMPVVETIDTLSDLDEDELDALILTEDEVKIKERLWMEFNKDYLANVAEKHLRAELDEKPIKKRDRKKRQQPRDSSMPSGETAAEATKQLLKQKKFSKKINYAAIDSLLAGDTADALEDMKNNVAGADGEITVNFFNGDDDNDDAVSTTSRAVSVAASERSNASISGTSGLKKRKRRSSSRASASLEEAERLKRKLEGSSLSSNKKRKNIFPTPSSSHIGGGLTNKDGKVLRPNLKRASMSNVNNGRHTAGPASGAGDPAKAQSSPTRSEATLPISEDVGDDGAQAGADGDMQMDLAPAVDEDDEEDDEREASAPPAAPDEDEDEMTAEFRRLQRGRSGDNDEDEDAGDGGDDAW